MHYHPVQLKAGIGEDDDACIAGVGEDYIHPYRGTWEEGQLRMILQNGRSVPLNVKVAECGEVVFGLFEVVSCHVPPNA